MNNSCNSNRLRRAFQLPVVKLITECSLKKLLYASSVVACCVITVGLTQQPVAQVWRKGFFPVTFLPVARKEATLTQITTHLRYSIRLLSRKTKFRFPTFLLRFVIFYWLRKKTTVLIWGRNQCGGYCLAPVFFWYLYKFFWRNDRCSVSKLFWDDWSGLFMVYLCLFQIKCNKWFLNSHLLNLNLLSY